jgi:hypothetical protein
MVDGERKWVFFLLKHAEKRDGARANEGERVK